MSEAIAMTKTTAPARRPLELSIEGKIISSRRHDGKTYTVVRCAAADEYSMPSTLEVRSAQRLGEAEEVVKLACRVSGTLRTFSFTDKNTGEVRKGSEGKVFFDVIE